MKFYQFGRTVGQELVLLDNDVALAPHRAEITEFDLVEVRIEDLSTKKNHFVT